LRVGVFGVVAEGFEKIGLGAFGVLADGLREFFGGEFVAALVVEDAGFFELGVHGGGRMFGGVRVRVF